MFFILSVVCLLSFYSFYGQSKKPINIEYSDFQDVNEDLVPGAFLLSGSVRINHDGAIITCNKAYFFKKENYLKLQWLATAIYAKKGRLLV